MVGSRGRRRACWQCAGLLAMIALMLLAAAPQAAAQLGEGRVNGHVRDNEGNVVEGAKVTAKLQGSGNVREATSEDDGSWTMAGMVGGFWEFQADKDGYRSQIASGPIMEAGRNPRIDFTLEKLADVVPGAGGAEGTQEDAGSDLAALMNKGNELHGQGKYEEAIAVYEEFAAAKPDFFNVFLNIGNSYLAMKNYAKAREYFEIVLEKKPGSLAALGAMGESYLAEENIEAATPYLSKAAELNASDPLLFYNLGVIFFNAKQGEAAVEHFEKAAQLKPDWPDPQLRLGYARLRLGNASGAADAFKKYLELAPEAPDAAEVRQFLKDLGQ